MIPLGIFPLLTEGNHRVTSPVSRAYNCIAWAAGDQTSWWWPDPKNVGYWPPGIPRVETMAAFVAVFQSLGYELCEHAEVEEGFEKIAIYALAGKPTHRPDSSQTGAGRASWAGRKTLSTSAGR
jgi:hypothetical protein